MPNVERGVVNAPNLDLRTLAQRRSMTPPASPSPTRGPNQSLLHGDPGGAGALPRQVSSVNPPDLRFNLDSAKMRQPQSAVEPGRGAVPIQPFTALGQPSRSLPIADEAKARPGR
jgi:hypothetical protein